MTARPLLLGLTALLLLSSLAAAQSDSRPSTVRYTFMCGDAEVIVDSTCIYRSASEHETQCTKQVVRLVNEKEGVSKQLAHDGKLVKEKSVGRRPVLDTFVTHWSCLKSQSGISYVLLWYTCKWGRSCEGTNREWERIFSLDGTDMTAGLRKHDDLERLDRLYQKLSVSSKDVHLHHVEY
jgi:hypothetical protein